MISDTGMPKDFKKSNFNWIEKNERNFLYFIKAISQQIFASNSLEYRG